MKRLPRFIFKIPFVLVLLTGGAHAAAAPSDSTRRSAIDAGGLHPPAYFERNVGQADRSVQFLSRALHSTLYVMEGGESLLRTTRGSLRMKLGGGAKSAAAGLEPRSGGVNYLIGRTAKDWRTNVPAYGAVRFERVYPGIDMLYRGAGQLEYDFVVSPGADPGAITLEFSDADRIELNEDGDLAFSVAGETLYHRKPRVYQTVGGVRHEIAGHYRLAGLGRVRFEIGAWDRMLPLVIDPVFSYGSFLGGAAADGAFSLALDSTGNIYVAGITGSGTLAPSGSTPVRGFSGMSDAFIAKLNPQGTALIYLTFLGGTDQDAAMAVSVDSQGNAYVTGGTNSKDFPVTSLAFQPRFGGTGGSALPPFTMPSGDGFVAKLNPTGTLVWSSYLGGAGQDQGYGIALDPSGAAVVAGSTSSIDFPVTTGALQTTRHGSSDSFVAHVSPDGARLLSSTYLGGSRENYAFALGVDPSGSAYIAGITSSDDFPVTPGAFQTRLTGRLAGFVAKLNGTGTGLAYATYLGGDNVTYAYGLAVDNSGSAYVTGATSATNFPITTGAFRWRAKSIGQGGDVFVTRLSPSGSTLMFSSVIGGNGPDFGRAIALDAAGDVYVTGSTAPYGNGRILDLPTSADAAQRCGSGNPTGFLMRVSADGAVLKHSSYLGGQLGGGTSGAAVAIGPQGRIYVAGSTTAADFPASAGAIQTTFAGANGSFDSTNLYPFAGDAFLLQADLNAKTAMTLGCVADSASLAPNLVSAGEIVSFFGSGLGPQDGVAAAFDSSGHLPTTLANVRVLVDDTPLPLLFVRSDQINAVMPFAPAGKSSAQIQVEYAGVRTPPLTVKVAAATPGIFTVDGSGSGQAAALNQDSSYNSPSTPAHPGEVVVLFATGAGPLDPVPADGTVIGGIPPRTLPTSAFVGSCPAEVLYSGSAPQLIAGAIQVNVRIPGQGTFCGVGDVPVVLLFGSVPSQTTVTISVR